MPSYIFEALRPVVHPTAFVHPEAVLIGDVVVGAGCYIGPGASLRGDYGRIEIGAGANVQDHCTVHSFPGRTVQVQEDGHIGHVAVLQGCTICRNALIGMNAVIMDNAIIAADCIVGALSFVRAGTSTQPGTLWAGVPARELRSVSADERAWKAKGTGVYQQLSVRCRESLSRCDPLAAEEPDRPRLTGDYVPLVEWRQRES